MYSFNEVLGISADGFKAKRAIMIANQTTTAAARERLFFALWPDPATRAALEGLQSAVSGVVMPPAKLHLTMAFLGQRPQAEWGALQALLAALPAAAPTLELDCWGYFSGQRIAWAGMRAPPPALLALRAELMRALAAARLAPAFEHDRFRPHVTLARKADAAPLAPFAPIRWHAGQLVLAASPAAGGGYRVLATRRLAPDRDD